MRAGDRHYARLKLSAARCFHRDTSAVPLRSSMRIRPRMRKVSDSGSLVFPVAHHAQNGETQRVRPGVLRTWCDYGFVAGFFTMDVIDV